MKVLVVHNAYRKRSGEEEALDNISCILRSAGHTVIEFFRTSSGLEDSTAQQIKAFFLGIHNPWAAAELRNLVRRESPDVVHAQNLYPWISTSVLRMCRDEGVPVVMRCPNYRVFCPTGLHLRDGAICEKCLGPWREWNCVSGNCEERLVKSVGYAARSAFARSTGVFHSCLSGVIVLSEFQLERFVSGGFDRQLLHVVPNLARAPTESCDAPPANGRISFIGRVSAEKGIDDFVEVARRRPSRKFHVIGGGDYLASVRAKAPSNITFMGQLSGSALETAFQESRVVVCPSKWFEGFPNVIAQAMARGRPVVSNSIGAIPEIVQHGKSGLLCDVGDFEGMASALDELMNNYDLCSEMGRNARDMAMTKYSEEAVRSALISAYQAAIDRNERLNK